MNLYSLLYLFLYFHSYSSSILYRQVDETPAAALEPPLKGFQILLIICGILFLSLLLLGLGCSYYCLRRRAVPAITRHPFSSIGTDSEITKLSGSSIGNWIFSVLTLTILITISF